RPTGRRASGERAAPPRGLRALPGRARGGAARPAELGARHPAAGLGPRVLGALRHAPHRRAGDPRADHRRRRARPADRPVPRGRRVSMFDLDGHVQHYAWGSRTAIPALLGREADGRSWAEVWFGAHPLAPATVPGGARLDAVIAADPAAMLGADVARAFEERLPYLLKIIAAERPLSLQVHPTRAHAAESFAAENAAGLALDSPL